LGTLTPCIEKVGEFGTHFCFDCDLRAWRRSICGDKPPSEGSNRRATGLYRRLAGFISVGVARRLRGRCQSPRPDVQAV